MISISPATINRGDLILPDEEEDKLGVLDLIDPDQDIPEGIYRIKDTDDFGLVSFLVFTDHLSDERTVLVACDDVLEPIKHDCWEDSDEVVYDDDAQLFLGIQFSDGTQFNLE